MTATRANVTFQHVALLERLSERFTATGKPVSVIELSNATGLPFRFITDGIRELAADGHLDADMSSAAPATSWRALGVTAVGTDTLARTAPFRSAVPAATLPIAPYLVDTSLLTRRFDDSSLRTAIVTVVDAVFAHLVRDLDQVEYLSDHGQGRLVVMALRCDERRGASRVYGHREFATYPTLEALVGSARTIVAKTMHAATLPSGW